MKIRWFIFVLLVLVMTININICAKTNSSNHLYVLWEGLEPDKCGVIWLVKRFVDKEAVFKFVPKGTVITSGIPIDTPDSKIQRRQNMCAIEVALQEFKISDPTLKRIGKIIWDIEINKWDKKVTPESAGFNTIIQGLTKKEKDDLKAIEASFYVYDYLYIGLGGSF